MDLRKKLQFFVLPFLISWSLILIEADAGQPSVLFHVSLDHSNHIFHVAMTINGIDEDTLVVKMPAWTPGYYQLLNFATQVSNFKASSSDGKEIFFTRFGKNGWKFPAGKKESFTIHYDVKTTRSFVATPYLDNDRGYISPTGVFMHIAGLISCSAMVTIDLPDNWIAASGLDMVKNSKNQFLAPDFDILYDSPILMGPLEELPSFEVGGVPHRFIGYRLGEFDRAGFMNDLKKIVEAAVAVIGDIPYKHYTFLAIGPGPGGIEHLNSTTFGFSADALKTDEGRKRMYTFLAHEYFHNYNVKRIRPVELGPFDYDKENRTNMLWVSEGITVYYDELLTRRAGLLTDEELLQALRGRLLGFENKPGRLFQSATEASYNTWSDGPFGRSGDEFNKTISVYDKGAILGLILDFSIRHATQNKKSLDHVMRALYREFYQEKKRGFTESEFQEVCERIVGIKLTEVFEYASTVKLIDYKKYFALGGLDIDTQPKEVPGAWLGISTRLQNDSLVVSNIEYESPAWNAGIRRKMVVLQVNGSSAKEYPINPMMQTENETIALNVFKNGQLIDFMIRPGKKVEPDYKITKVSNPTNLQKAILTSWLNQ